MNKLFILIIILLSTIHIATAQTKSITASIGKILKDRKADVGVAVYLFSNGDTISINGDRHFPLQSVFKFHIALTVLNEVDKGCLSLKQKINITKAD
ncbi:MAG: serine hydrolase, partial [Odoribacter sp.]